MLFLASGTFLIVIQCLGTKSHYVSIITVPGTFYKPDGGLPNPDLT